jgi:3',5'-cyclic-AMP phosphodiesterase
MLVPTHTIAHLTDLHLRPASGLVDGVVDADAQLLRALDVLAGWDHRVDAWFFGGDLVDEGDAATYIRLRSLVEPAARRAGVRVIWAHGNHDDPDAFARGLWGAASGDMNRTHDLGGLRLIALDSCVAGEPYGLVSDASLAWLSGELAEPAPHGTILALHHPPVPPVQDAAGLWDLGNPGALASVVGGSDVRLIIGGHFHQTSFTTLGGVPVAAASSVAYAQDLTAGRTLRGQDAGQGFNLIQVYPGQVVVTAVPLDAARRVHEVLTPADVRRLLG